MMKESQRAFVFPGQGSQRVGMGRELYNQHEIARRTFEQADDTLEINLTTLCFQGPAEKLLQTINAQPAILVVSIATLRVLEQMDIHPDQVAGHSLGEYSALIAAEALSFVQALKLVRARGEYMQQAGQQNSGKMAAILKLSVEDVRKICSLSGAEIANINSPGQVVISGRDESVDYASELAMDANGRIVGLRASIAGHSSLMKPAVRGLEIALAGVDISDPSLPFVANTTGDYVSTASGVRRCLIDQMTAPVRWLDSIRTMIDDGVDEFVDVGPGTVLTGIIKRIDRDVAVKIANNLIDSG